MWRARERSIANLFNLFSFLGFFYKFVRYMIRLSSTGLWMIAIFGYRSHSKLKVLATSLGILLCLGSKKEKKETLCRHLKKTHCHYYYYYYYFKSPIYRQLKKSKFANPKNKTSEEI